MSIQATGIVPEWSKGDRLRKARTITGKTTREFADLIGVSQATVTNAENDNNKVRRITMRAWAMATGVSIEWLETGNAPQPHGPEGIYDERTRRDSNPQPSDPKVRVYLAEVA